MTSLLSNQWLFIPTVAIVLLAISEVGFRTGSKLHLTKDEARKSQVGGVQGAVLGLLGLLLGFTFAMAVGRHDARREMVLKESNAIGTTYLRAGLLPGGHVAPVKELLKRYVDIRVEYRNVFNDPTKLAQGLRDCAEIQELLWEHAEAAAKEAPTPIVASFVSTLNDMIDADAERRAAGRNHIPTTVWLLVVLVAAFGCFTSAYGSGAQGARSNFTSFFLPILIAVVIGLVFDIDHALQGAIGISQQPMLELQESIAN